MRPPPASLSHYTSPDEDSACSWDFPSRSGDIVVSTRSKSGTTWVQMICLVLVLAQPELPDGDGGCRLAGLAGGTQEEVFARLADQTHRRVIKTHTPLDGVPLDDSRHVHRRRTSPLDMAVSLYHDRDNIDRGRGGAHGSTQRDRPPHPPLHEWLLRFIDSEGDLRLAGHVARGDAPSLRRLRPPPRPQCRAGALRQPAGRPRRSMRRLAGLDIRVDEECWPALVGRPPSSRCAPMPPHPARTSASSRIPALFPPRKSVEGRALLGAEKMAHYRDACLQWPPTACWPRWNETGRSEHADRPGRQGLDVVLERPCPECGFDAPSVPPGVRRRPGCVPTRRPRARVLRQPVDAVRRRPADDRWAPFEYACHMRDVCASIHERLVPVLRSGSDPPCTRGNRTRTPPPSRSATAREPQQSCRLQLHGPGLRLGRGLGRRATCAIGGPDGPPQRRRPASHCWLQPLPAPRAGSSSPRCIRAFQVLSTRPPAEDLSRGAGAPRRARGRRRRGRSSAALRPGTRW